MKRSRYLRAGYALLVSGVFLVLPACNGLNESLPANLSNLNLAPPTLTTTTAPTATPIATPVATPVPTPVPLITTNPIVNPNAVSFVYTGSKVNSVFAPPNPSMPISSDLFSMTLVNIAFQNSSTAKNVTPFPPFPVSALRLWDVAEWAAMEWKKGSIDWSKMDNTIAVAEKNGVHDFIQTFGHLPAWAALNPTTPCPNGEGKGSCSPPIMSEFDIWVKATVQRYCGKVKYYEPWNEPNSASFWSGTNVQLLEVAEHVYQIAKDPANCGCTNGICKPNGGVNPNKVLSPPITGIFGAPWATDLAWLNAYLGTAGAVYPYADIAAFHGYVQQTPELLASQLAGFKAVLAAHGLGNLAIWNTEGSYEFDYHLTDTAAASFVIRYYVAQASVGISRVFWYAYDHCSWGSLFAPTNCSTPSWPSSVPGEITPSGEAYGTAENWLSGAALNSCQRYVNGLWICALERAGGYQAWVMWSTGASVTVPVPQAIRAKDYRDWQNKLHASVPSQLVVTQMPVLIENAQPEE